MSKVMIYWDDKVRAYCLKVSDLSRVKKFVDFLKTQIPHSDRDYDEINKVWTFNEKYLDGTVKLANVVFGAPEVALLTRAQVEAAQSAQAKAVTTNEFSELDKVLSDFVRLLPYDAARRAYLIASKELHPDFGGSMESMTRLNSLWQRIEKEIYKQ